MQTISKRGQGGKGTFCEDFIAVLEEDETLNTDTVVSDAVACHLCGSVREQNARAGVLRILTSVQKLHTTHQKRMCLFSFKNEVVCFFLFHRSYHHHCDVCEHAEAIAVAK
jgi:hypothetical protein